jgi:UvrB interaction domain/MFD, D3 domain
MPSLFHPPLPAPRARQRWHQLYGSARSLAIAEAVASDSRPYLVIARDARELDQLRAELGFFLGDAARIHALPDWEVLPYDIFSPHPDIISERLAALAELPRLKSAVLLAAADTLGQRLAPRGYVDGRTFNLAVGDRLPLEPLRARLVESGYASVHQVSAPGEFALRGSLFDVFPMGAATPLRVDLFDDEIEAIREFDPESQRSGASLRQVRLLPGREMPLDADAVKAFRLRYRKRFEGDPTRSVIYRGVSDGLAPPGIEFYLPLFFDSTDTLLDYLPPETVVCAARDIGGAVERAARVVAERYEERRHDIERPVLAPDELYLPPEELEARLASFTRIDYESFKVEDSGQGYNFPTGAPQEWRVDLRAEKPLAPLAAFIAQFPGRVLLAADSAGRREVLLEMLRATALAPQTVNGWQEFVSGDARFAISIAPEMAGLHVTAPPIAVLGEAQLFGQRARQERRRRRAASCAISPRSARGRRWCTKNMEWAATSACRSCRWPDRTASSWCWNTPAGTSSTCLFSSCTWCRVTPARRPTAHRCTSSAPINGPRRASVPPSRSATSPRNCSTSMRSARRAAGRRCRRASSNTRPLPRASPSRKPPTRRRPSARSWKISTARSPWIAWFAVTWASARPRWHCAPPSWRSPAASRWRCSHPPRSWPSSTTRTSPTASRSGR